MLTDGREDMKITVEHLGSKIVADEGDTPETSMRYTDQNKLIQEIITVICEQMLKLQPPVVKT